MMTDNLLPFEIGKMEFLLAIRQIGIIDPNLLSAFEKVPREKFIPDYLHGFAYDVSPLTIEMGLMLEHPQYLARCFQQLNLSPHQKQTIP